MRSSLSCELCRKSKVKCVNSGQPPCTKCAKLGVRGCVLTRPSVKQHRRFEGPRQGRTRTAAVRRGHEVTTDAEIHVAPDSPVQAVQASEVVHDNSLPTRPVAGICKRETTDQHLVNLPSSVILRSLKFLLEKFPELSIIHVPTFIQEFQATHSPENKMLLAAILALVKNQMLILEPSWTSGLISRELYASYAKEVIMELVLQPPKIQVVQTLLVLTLHEWGTREFHKAWVYSGMAIRIMQALHSLRIAPYLLDNPEDNRDTISLAVETRTFWACFIMDRMVNSGTFNPPALSMSEMHKLRVPRPPNAVEFAFSPDTMLQFMGVEQHLTYADGNSSAILDVTQSFELIAAGFDIWAQVMAFVLNDGRRAPGMCSPDNCPWVPGSFWAKLRGQLEAWRASQHPRLHYPKNSVTVHMTLGYGESFVYLNLLYYVSVAMLHREYFPFLPTTVLEPRGPIDHPMLEAEAPPGWWEDSAQELFGAAERMGDLLQEASDCSVSVLTPFAGFCAFTACYMNVYIFRFPQINLGRSTRAEELAESCLSYLKEFRKAWKLGDGWVKTIQHASLLYRRATADKRRYIGKSRADFDHLHHSVHEFRVVDRTDQHLHEIDSAERGGSPVDANLEDYNKSLNQSAGSEVLLDQILTEVNGQDQILWPHWWSNLEGMDMGLPITPSQ